MGQASPRLRRLLLVRWLPRRAPPAARPRRPARGPLQHPHARVQAPARADPGRLLARGERGRLGAVSEQPGERLRPGRLRTSAGGSVPSQPRLPASGAQRLRAAIAARATDPEPSCARIAVPATRVQGGARRPTACFRRCSPRPAPRPPAPNRARGARSAPSFPAGCGPGASR